ncbi:MAG: tetraacyldisaccharide 4'-kinase [Gammaproteobacteria bacterium]|nr:MAG: tetraacyldisaccharide 4'-kinase [Gammaproteobacteria bacterium]
MNWQKFWQKRGIGNYVLLPLSAVFYGVTAVRRYLYHGGLLQSAKAPLPVVVVGNINVGGAGKTPLVIALGKWLAENNIAYAVIAKGYGGSYTRPTVVTAEQSAAVVGDEPLLIKLKCDCPVVVAKSRLQAATIVAQTFPETQIILTDDGLQHYALQRQMEICVINAKVGLGNAWLLPAGGLREPPSRLKQVDFVVYNGGVEHPHHYLLADRGWYHINSGQKRYHDEFCGDKSQNLAISAIAHPALFFQRLKALGIAAQTRPLPDHHPITAGDLPADKTLLMTEKDWVKAKVFTHTDAWYLSVEAVLSEALKRDFLIQVQRIIGS